MKQDYKKELDFSTASLAIFMSRLPGIKVRKKKNAELPLFSFFIGLIAFFPNYLLMGYLAYMKFPPWAYAIMNHYKVFGVIFIEIVFLVLPFVVLNGIITQIWFRVFANPSFKSKLGLLSAFLLPILVINFTGIIGETIQSIIDRPHILFVVFSPILGPLFICLKVK